MRNLQKILALVMAMVMSFSLLATVNAADFPDAGEISETYSDAVTVLNGLKVFQGYKEDGTFRPKGNITRAEVAAIIYRIVTGDVDDTQKDIYSSWGKFNDVLDGSWYAGYVNYCANAGYIKGYNNTTFGPNDQVTGYQALAMILRAVGYDKNGEFTGSQWQIRTASIARERGVTKNVTDTLLGQAATRETVAELLFRSIIIPKVDFNANTLSYTVRGDKETLGYESLKLEELTGIVTANEYADLENTKALNSGKTRMVVKVDGKDTNYTLDYSEGNLLDGLDAIGEKHTAYIQNANTTSAKVLAMENTNVRESYVTLEKKDIKSDSDFRNVTGYQRGSETETKQFINFGEDSSAWKSDWRIRYVVRVNGSTENDAIANAVSAGFDIPKSGYTYANGVLTYEEVFKINEEIGARGRTNIEKIFNVADKYGNNYVTGEVYAGTESNKDRSDEMSFKEFKNQFINTDKITNVEGNEYGNWLKVIDNDDDGQADYVLKVVYTMAQVVRAKDGKYGLDVEDKVLCKGREAVNYLDEDNVKSEDTLVLDDIVYYAVIDEVPWATKAEMVTSKVDTVNRKDEKITTADGTEYLQSGVCGEDVVSNDYNCGVVNMNGSATYDMFLDRGGYMALFRDSHNDFTLIVDGWYNRVKSGTEYSVRAYNDENGRQEVVDINRGGSLFIGDVEWTADRTVLNNNWYALKWLGNTTGDEALKNVNSSKTDYNAGKLNGGMPSSDSATAANGDPNYVKTTVATLSGDVIQPVDYSTVGGNKVVRMLAPAKNEIPKAAASYHAKVYSTSGTDTAYNVLNDGEAEVRALSSTVYYLVYPAVGAESGFAVERYVGYSNVPDVKEGYIEDVYAVGTRQDRTSTLGQSTYYTANVVVVELNNRYKGNQEQVFIYDMPVVSSSVTIEEVGLIHENGTKEDGVKIDFGKSRIRDYQVAMNVSDGWRNWGPGLYYMYPTNEEGVYTVQPMYAEDIAATDYVVGWSNTSYGTVGDDYISVVALNGNVVNRYSNSIDIAYDVVEKSVNRNDCTIYTLSYNGRGVADLGVYEATEGNIRQYLSEQADVGKGNDYAPYDHSRWSDGNNWRTENWNQNRVLVHYKDNNAKYAISFSNKTVDNAFARKVWTSSLPDSDRTRTIWAGKAGAVRFVETLLRLSTSNTNNAWLVDVDTPHSGLGDRYVATIQRAMCELNEAALKNSSVYSQYHDLFNKLSQKLHDENVIHQCVYWDDGGETSTPNYDAAAKTWSENDYDLSKLSADEVKELQAAVTAAKENEKGLLNEDQMALLDEIQAAINALGTIEKKAELDVRIQLPEDFTGTTPTVSADVNGVAVSEVTTGTTTEVTLTIAGMTGLAVESITVDGTPQTVATSNVQKVTVNPAADATSVVIEIKLKNDNGGEDATEVTSGDTVKLAESLEGKIIDLTVKPATGTLNPEQWYWVQSTSLTDAEHGDYHAAKTDSEGKLTFKYTVQESDTTKGDGLSITISTRTVMESERYPGTLMGFINADMDMHDFYPVHFGASTYNLFKMARSAADNDVPAGRPYTGTGAVVEMTIGDKTFYYVKGEDGVYRVAPEKKQEVIEAAQTATTFDMDYDDTVKGMDKTTITTDENGNITGVVLALGQPKGPGAKLPTNMTITSDKDGETTSLKVTVTWYDVDGNIVEYANNGTTGYTYTVTIDPESVSEDDFSDENEGQITITKLETDEDGELVFDEATGEPVKAAETTVDKTELAEEGLTVDKDAEGDEGITTGVYYTVTVNAADGIEVVEAPAPEDLVKSGETVDITFAVELEDGDEIVVTVNDDDMRDDVVDNEDGTYTISVEVTKNTTVAISVDNGGEPNPDEITMTIDVADDLTLVNTDIAEDGTVTFPAEREGETYDVTVKVEDATDDTTIVVTDEDGNEVKDVTISRGTTEDTKNTWTIKLTITDGATYVISKDAVLDTITVNVTIDGEDATATKQTDGTYVVELEEGYTLDKFECETEGVDCTAEGNIVTIDVSEVAEDVEEINVNLITKVDVEGKITVTLKTEDKTITNGTGTVEVGEDTTASFTLTLRYNSDEPVVTKVTAVEADGTNSVVTDYSNIKIEKNTDGTWAVTVSNVEKSLTVEVKSCAPSIVNVTKESGDAHIVTITPATATAVNEDLTFAVEVNDGYQPSVVGTVKDCELVWEKADTTNSSNNYVWTLTVKNAPEGTTTITLRSSTLLQVRLQNTTSTVIGEGSDVNVYKDAVDGKVSFTIKMTTPDQAPLVDNDPNKEWVYDYDEETNVWTISCEKVNSADATRGLITKDLMIVNADWVTIESGDGVTVNRTKISRNVDMDSRTRKATVNVVLDEGYTPKNTTVVMYDKTANDDGSYTVTLDLTDTKVTSVKIEAQGDVLATLTTEGSAIKMGTLPKAGIVTWDDKKSQGEAVFDNISVNTGYFLSEAPVSVINGEKRIVKQVVTENTDGTYTVTVTFSKKEDIALEITATKSYGMKLTSSDAKVTITNSGLSYEREKDNLVATVDVEKNYMPVVTSVNLGSASGGGISTENAKVNRLTSGTNSNTWQIAIPYSVLTNDVYITLGTKEEGDPWNITIEGVESEANKPYDEWSTKFGTLDATTTKTTVDSKVSFTLSVNEGYIPVVATTLTVPITNRTYSYEKGSTNNGKTAWTITFDYGECGNPGASASQTEKIGLTKAANVVSKNSTLGQTLNNEMLYKDYEETTPTNKRTVNIMDFVNDNLTVEETIDENGVHVLTVSGVVNNWIDKDWWEAAGDYNGSVEKVTSYSKTDKKLYKDGTKVYSDIMGWFFEGNNWGWDSSPVDSENNPDGKTVAQQLSISGNQGYDFNVDASTKIGFTAIQLPKFADATEKHETDNVLLCAVAEDGVITVAPAMADREKYATYELRFDGVTFGTQAADWAVTYKKQPAKYAEIVKRSTAAGSDWLAVKNMVENGGANTTFDILKLVSDGNDLSVTEKIGDYGVHELTVTGTLNNYITKSWYDAAGLANRVGETEDPNYANVLGWFYGSNNWAWSKPSTSPENSVCGQLDGTSYGTAAGNNGYVLPIDDNSALGFTVIKLPKEVIYGCNADGSVCTAGGTHSTDHKDYYAVCAVVNGGKFVISKDNKVLYEVTFNVDLGTKAKPWVEINEISADDPNSGTLSLSDEVEAIETTPAEAPTPDEDIVETPAPILEEVKETPAEQDTVDEVEELVENNG